MRRSIGLVAIACAGLTMLTRPGFAWGPEGHRVIAVIAEQVLRRSDPAVLAKVSSLLATDRTNRLTRTDIAEEATWADVLVEKSPEARTATTAWHSTRLSADNPDLAAACFGHPPLPAGYPASHGPQNNCSIDKIAQFSAELKNPQTSSYERLAALQFLLNLVGDLNDPLHQIDRGDQAGACTVVQIAGKPPQALSTLWQDTLVREVVGPDPARGAARILGSVPAAEAQKWTTGDPAAWARDTFEVAQATVYGFGGAKPAGKITFQGKGAGACPSADLYRVTSDYETKALAAVKQQLAKGGIRLARVLRDSVR